MALFQQPVQAPGQVHVEFRAGLCEWDGKSKVVPDKRKGKVVLCTSTEDQMMHLQWVDRENNKVETDLFIVADAYLERIEKCKTGKTIDGRVYILRFTSSKKKMFFWMQEPDETGDAEKVKKFNESIGATIPDNKPTGATGSAAAASQQEVDPQLREILNQFLANQGAVGQRQPPLSLNSVLTTDVLQGLLTDDKAVEEMQALMPEGQRTKDDLKNALVSPQLQQSLNSLSQAVHSDQLPLLFASLGLDATAITTAAPGTDALEVLCKAMEAQMGEGPAPDAAGAGNDGSSPA